VRLTSLVPHHVPFAAVPFLPALQSNFHVAPFCGAKVELFLFSTPPPTPPFGNRFLFFSVRQTKAVQVLPPVFFPSEPKAFFFLPRPFQICFSSSPLQNTFKQVSVCAPFFFLGAPFIMINPTSPAFPLPRIQINTQPQSPSRSRSPKPLNLRRPHFPPPSLL